MHGKQTRKVRRTKYLSYDNQVVIFDKHKHRRRAHPYNNNVNNIL